MPNRRNFEAGNESTAEESLSEPVRREWGSYVTPDVDCRVQVQGTGSAFGR